MRGEEVNVQCRGKENQGKVTLEDLARHRCRDDDDDYEDDDAFVVQFYLALLMA
uniref:Uncharacterized protein n=1 Tax=Rhizophora mucronata TaxID=61149 RepID=A0A2P2N6K2_RHIMU